MTGTWKSVVWAAAFVAAAGCAGCGDGKKDEKKADGDKASPAAKPAAGGAAYDAAKSTASVKITVKWAGAAPTPTLVPITASQSDCPHEAQVWAERTVVGAGGALGNTFVSASDGPHKKMSGLPDSPAVTLDQHGCMYVPHVFGLRAGQMFTVKNSDGTKHNVHARPNKNKNEINQSQDPNQKNEFKFDQTETAIPFNCDVHSWMNATAFVLDHPFFGVTDAAGNVEIKGLPAGDYTFKLWHEGMTPATAQTGVKSEFTITLKDGEAANKAVELK
jgi:hypothetical protein